MLARPSPHHAALALCVLLPGACVDRSLVSTTDATTDDTSTSTPGGNATTDTPTSPDPPATTLPPPGDPTTTNPTPDATTTNATDPPPDLSTSEAASSSTTGDPSQFGKCGWVPRSLFYACEPDGGIPGLIDPEGLAPIDCAGGVVEGAACDGENPVNQEGCCTPGGTLFFCDTLTDPNAARIVRQDCGV